MTYSYDEIKRKIERELAIIDLAKDAEGNISEALWLADCFLKDDPHAAEKLMGEFKLDKLGFCKKSRRLMLDLSALPVTPPGKQKWAFRQGYLRYMRDSLKLENPHKDWGAGLSSKYSSFHGGFFRALRDCEKAKRERPGTAPQLQMAWRVTSRRSGRRLWLFHMPKV